MKKDYRLKIERLDELFEQRNCLRTISFDYVDEGVIEFALDKINKEIEREMVE